MLDMLASPFTTAIQVREPKCEVGQPPSSNDDTPLDGAPPQREVRECGSINVRQLQRATPETEGRRSVSCIEFGVAERRFRTISIGKDSAELHQLADANVNQLVQIAISTASADSVNALLARKALRYRKIWTDSTEAPP